jgi:ATP-dependent RNA helicase RhlE
MPFSTLGLSDHIVQGVHASGYTTPTQIQTLAIPKILDAKDVIGCAQTGTGKTAAFVLPMLHSMSAERKTRKRAAVRGLVLAPTRELALQVDEAIGIYGKFTSIRSTSIFGGVNMENQIKRLNRGVDIVVATPGRLLDHISRRTIDLSQVSYLVLDEADRMFDMGFINDVRKIIAKIPTKRQTLMFSATMSTQIRQLVRSVQKDAEEIEVGERRSPVESVTQKFYAVKQDSKMDLLFHILRTEKLESVLVFSRTKHNADRITRRLGNAGFNAVAIHSNRTQAQRQRALAGFKQGQYTILVATDIAARGIDVEGISHVINFDTPVYAEDYIHRIGRTGRASAIGDAITFVSDKERDPHRRIERFIGKRDVLRGYPDFDPKKSAAQRPVRKTKQAAKPQKSSERPNRKARPAKSDTRREYTKGRDEKRRNRTKPTSPAREEPIIGKKADWTSLINEAERSPLRKRISKIFGN